VFRANPSYELVLLDNLVASERELVRVLADEADLYGVLRPTAGSGLELRAADTDTALLFLTLREPAPLPGYLTERLGPELDQTICRLVVDGVLEVEDGGGFLVGRDAAAVLLAGRSSGGKGRIGELSRAALRYGQELVGLPRGELALRLYGYGRRPLSPALTARLPTERDVGRFLRLEPEETDTARALAEGWSEVVQTAAGRRHWRTWRSRTAQPSSDAESGFKLYVSPDLGGLPVAVAAVATGAARSGAKAFKVGATAGDLCRPDKLVVYFDSLDELHAAATDLVVLLADCPAHGVPFTASVTEEGTLSWGADPPTFAADTGGTTSWRLWVSALLAEYLEAGAAGEAAELEPWQFALERLRLAGVDTDDWVPRRGMWQEAQAKA
jgi:hypothetical protein